MRILIYGINYAPELTGIGKYTGEMASWLANEGHHVQVVTAMPYYPEWKVNEQYKGKLWFKEVIDGVNVIRCPLYIPSKVSSLKRILHEFSFLASVFPVWFKSLFQQKYDAVFCIAPPFHLGLLPLLYAKLRKTPLISHIQDLQVDAAKDLGMIKNKSFLNFMFRAERFILNKSTKVATISQGMKRKIQAKGIPDQKILMFPNWVDENEIYPLPKEKSLRKELGIGEDDYVILYSGNLGEKQGLEMIIEVAANFTGHKNVRFVICGSGGGKDKLVALAKEAALDNLSFFPLQPYNKLSALLASADVHLVLQKKSASDLVMPSKLTGILSSGGFSIVTALPGTSLYDVVDEHKLGLLIEPESAPALTKAIQASLAMDINIYKNNARNYSVKNLSKDHILKRFEQSLMELLPEADTGNYAIKSSRY